MGLFCSVEVAEVAANGVKYRHKDGTERFADACLVLYCCGSRTNDGEAKALEGVCPHFVVTGDGKRARTVKEAAYEGFCAAMDIL